jgi:hypothetical protein
MLKPRGIRGTPRIAVTTIDTGGCTLDEIRRSIENTLDDMITDNPLMTIQVLPVLHERFSRARKSDDPVSGFVLIGMNPPRLMDQP